MVLSRGSGTGAVYIKVLDLVEWVDERTKCSALVVGKTVHIHALLIAGGFPTLEDHCGHDTVFVTTLAEVVDFCSDHGVSFPAAISAHVADLYQAVLITRGKLQ